MPNSREDSVYLAKLAEQAERYEGVYVTVHFVQMSSFNLRWWRT